MFLTYLFSTDHKVIGLLYAFTSLFFLLVGFSLVVIIRWQLAFPGQPVPHIGNLSRHARDVVDLARRRRAGGRDHPPRVFLHSRLELARRRVSSEQQSIVVRVKQDATPGISQPVWFTPTRTGEWEIACSQLCGLGHYRMKGFYTIQTQADFDAWLARETAALGAP